MKTLRQVTEGTVVSADFKISKSGRKYKAHRREMGNPTSNMREDMEQVDELSYGTLRSYTDKAKAENLPGKGGNRGVALLTPGTRDKGVHKAVDRMKKMKTNEAKDPREYDYEGDMAKSQLRSIIVNAKQVHDMLKDDTNMAEWVQSKITLAADYIGTVADYMQSEVKEEVEQVDELKKSTLRSYLKKAVPSHGDQEFISRAARDPEEKADAKRTASNRATGIIRANKGLKSAHTATMKEGTMRGGKYVDDAPRPGTNEVPSPDEGYRPPKKPMKKPSQMGTTKATDTSDVEENYNPYLSILGEAETMEKGKEKEKEKQEIKKQGSEVPGPQRDTSVGTKMNNALKKIIDIFAGGRGMDEEVKLDEGRGRPRKSAAPSKSEDDEGEEYGPDSGMEADQHIHVQLKKAVDSTAKPYEVNFKNGKKHTVSSNVAKTILNATEKLKPEHRKTVHDEIHKSYDSLIAVHKVIAGN